MLKTIFWSLVTVLLASTAHAQKIIDRPIKSGAVSWTKTFDLTLTLDSSIDPKRAYIQYDDGKSIAAILSNQTRTSCLNYWKA